ncbi:SHOCT domain-containing protein [Microbacterium hatanonis]|uniref:Cardiolipin synthase N-terminal domain-containing protein n=1 Tax=Microbacterium hatanonis TaxID=404366 RepID=A0A5C8I425_9MICO|nr:SHOCT domain-containing protein [Microbacterium hatanonis]TXK12653.1 hypothetical protein FVP77_04110 [Microbacterium hatanonis]
MFNWNDLWSAMWSFFWIFAFVAYLFALFAVVADLFRDHKLSGWWKAVWVFFLVFVPFLTVLVYLIARGPGMQERTERDSRRAQQAAEEYIRGVADTASPADEITKAKSLMDSGAISAQEFEHLKARALSHGA